MSEEAPETAPTEGAPPTETPDASGNPAGVPQAPPGTAPRSEVKGDALPSPAAPVYRPNYVFLAGVAIVSLVLDLGTKAWAKVRLDDAKTFAERHIDVITDHLAFSFAKNRGGAWGILQEEPESVRRPFFLAISALAIGFIVSLYRKLTPRQWALKWGLPLVLGGALGNLVNRIQYNYVIDFIDYRADWMRKLNGLTSDHPSDHWPTFNIADIAIVAGVVLMAVDMFTPTPKIELAPKLDAEPGKEPEDASKVEKIVTPEQAPPVDAAG
jgi:signal peptidase II